MTNCIDKSIHFFTVVSMRRNSQSVQTSRAPGAATVLRSGNIAGAQLARPRIATRRPRSRLAKPYRGYASRPR